jgi:hypothetical protein
MCSQAADLKTEYSTVEEKLSLFKPHFLIILAAKKMYSKFRKVQIIPVLMNFLQI